MKDKHNTLKLYSRLLRYITPYKFVIFLIVNIRTDMFAKLHRLPLSTHHEYGSGKMMS